MVKIELLILGDIYPVNLNKIKSFSDNSKIFKITEHSEILNPEILNGQSIRLLDNDFNGFLNNSTNYDFRVIVVNRPLENNLFTRRISTNLITISIFDIGSLNMQEGISVEMYINRFLLAFTTIFKFYRGFPPNEIDLIRKNATGCLFDLCIFKPQIAMFFRTPKLSSESISLLERGELPTGFIENLKKDIKKLKIGNYYVLKDWLKENPIKAIIITFLIGFVFSEILGNYVYDLIHPHLPFISND